MIYYKEIMANVYTKVKTFTDGFLNWYLIKEYDNFNKEIPLKKAQKDGLYIMRLVDGRWKYMPVTEIKRQKPYPLLKFKDGELSLLEALRDLYLGPSYKDHEVYEKMAAEKWDAAAPERIAAEKKKQKDAADAAAAEKKKQKDAAAAKIKRMEEERDQKQKREEEFGNFMSGYPATAPAPAPAPAATASPPDAVNTASAASSNTSADNDDGFDAANYAFGGNVNRGFFDQMTKGGKRKKSRKPKRRNSRSNRRKTLNKSKK